jgi:P-type E1-E2 ATPase
MLTLDIPGRGALTLKTVLLDVNGTIAEGGVLIDGVSGMLAELSARLRVVAVTADTHGTANVLREAAGIEIRVIERGGEAEQKLALLELLGAQSTVAIGNGSNDALVLASAAVGIAVIGGEGASLRAVHSADIVVTDVRHALGLLRDPGRLIATLRT